MEDFFDTKFYAWHREHHVTYGDEIASLRKEALALLVASVEEGDLTSLDGVKSPVSRRIQDHHRVSNFEMNALWIGANQDWVCPCCGRTKFQIARVGKSGQILAKLVVHHDHMGEALKEAFHSAFASSGTEVAQVEGLKLVERMGTAFAAFTNTLICEDCNHADVLATKHIGSPPYFSFSVGQMSQFILSKDHQTHQVDYEIVDRIWAKAQAAYRLRMELMQKIAYASATDAHWYEPTPPLVDPVPTLELSQRRFGDHFINKWVSSEDLVRALGPKTKTGKRDFSKWRKNKFKPGKALPTNYLAMLRSEPAHAARWDALPADWKCPICKRSKFEIVYVGDKGKVTLGVHGHNESGKWSNAQTFCVNCMTVLLGLKHEVVHITGKELVSSYKFLCPDELASIIIARPHSSHEVRPAEAEALLKRIAERQAT